MKIKELRWIGTNELRALCIKHDWFTNGTNDAYNHLFDMVRLHWVHKESLTPARLLKIAQYIADHSDPNTCDILDIDGMVYCLCEISHSCFTIEG